MIELEDNNTKNIESINPQEKELITTLSEHSLNRLIEKDNVLVFPNSFQAGDGDQHVLTSHCQETCWSVQTYNLIGYIGKGDAEIKNQFSFRCSRSVQLLTLSLAKNSKCQLV